MDDQQTYLLNGLLARHFSLGRIVRFRPVQRGRQAQCIELFTAQEREYLAQIFPAACTVDDLQFMAQSVNTLDQERFSVAPFLPAKTDGKTDGFVGQGPQNSHLLVSLLPEGSALSLTEYTEHDISQIGLRLAWMHRLFKEQLPAPNSAAPVQKLTAALLTIPDSLLPAAARTHLLDLLAEPVPINWIHAGIHPASLLHDADHQLRTITDWVSLRPGCPLTDLLDAILFLTQDAAGTPIPNFRKALLESYDSLSPLKSTAWLPVTAHWCAHHLENPAAPPPAFLAIARHPTPFAAALAKFF